MHRLVPTPVGDARITVHEAAGARAVLALGHGAGGGVEAPDLVALAAALPPLGFTVALVEQPWRVAGKKLGPAPRTLDEAWRPVMAELVGRGLPVVAGGRSAGARVACRTGSTTGAAAVLALAFPLHPPGKPEKSRAEELLATGLPTLVVQGGADAFGTPEEFGPLPDGHRLVALPYAGHGFAVPKRAPVDQEGTLAALVGAVAGWLRELPAIG